MTIAVPAPASTWPVPVSPTRAEPPSLEMFKAAVFVLSDAGAKVTDTVVEAPNGAHFTTNEPDYKRDEKFQRHYAEAASSDESWQEFVETYLSGSEADYQAAVRKFGESQ